MTREEIENMSADREADAKIYAFVFGGMPFVSDGNWVYSTDREYLEEGDAYYLDENQAIVRMPEYSKDMRAAWEVHQVMVHKIFSKRKRYFDELQRVVSSEYTELGKSLIAYPDVFIFVKPSHFCKAALLVVMEDE